MNAAEIAETLNNGNIAQARQEILRTHDDFPRIGYDAAVRALEVVRELAFLMVDSGFPDFQAALGKVRRCLEGGS